MTAPRHAVRPRRWLKPLLGALVAVLVGSVGVGAWVAMHAQSAVNQATDGQGGAAVDILLPKPLIGESTGRVNVLLVGSSFDDAGHDGAVLTDSIMVASMDLTTKQVALISIPRDMWVSYAGRQMKVNAVYPAAAGTGAGSDDLGDWRKGLSELGLVAESMTGLHIDHHVMVGYSALQEVIDAVGGVDVTIDSPDSRGIYDPNAGVQLPNGDAHLDGKTALALTRARNHPVPGKRPYGLPKGDFDRAENQRMVLQAVQAKVKTSPALANPTTVVDILNTVSRNVRMDLSVSQIRRVLDLAMDSDKTKSASIRGTDKSLLIRDAKVGGQSVLLPVGGANNYAAMRAYVAKVCGITST